MHKALTLCLGLAAGLLLNAGAGAQVIYKSERNGVTTYSAKPGPDSNVVKLPELSVIPGNSSSSHQGSTGSLPTLQVPESMIPSNSGNLLPPPPPSFGGKPAPARTVSREELQMQLSKARADLAAQEDIRLGDERNYQKKLDRIKPFQDKVEELSKALGLMP